VKIKRGPFLFGLCEKKKSFLIVMNHLLKIFSGAPIWVWAALVFHQFNNEVRPIQR